MGDPISGYMGDIERTGSGAPVSDDERLRRIITQMLPQYMQQDPGRAARIAMALQGQGQGQPQQRVFRQQPQSLQLPQQGSPSMPPPGSQAPGAAGWSGQMPQQMMAKLAGMMGGGGQPQGPQPGPDFDRSFAGLGVPEGTPGIEKLQGGGFSMSPNRNGPDPNPPMDVAAGRQLGAGAQQALMKMMSMFGSQSAQAAPRQMQYRNLNPSAGGQQPPGPPLRQIAPTSGMPRQMVPPTYAGPQPMPQGQEQYPFVANDPEKYGEPQDQADLSYDLIQRYLRHKGQGR